MDDWKDCRKQMPLERIEGCGTVSDRVVVELSDGRITTDWLINGKWVIHCKTNGGAYPVKWKEIDKII